MVLLTIANRKCTMLNVNRCLVQYAVCVNSVDAIGSKAYLSTCLLYIVPLCHVLP